MEVMLGSTTTAAIDGANSLLPLWAEMFHLFINILQIHLLRLAGHKILPVKTLQIDNINSK
jgi:hypothetical protein